MLYNYPIDLFDNKRYLFNKKNFWRISDSKSKKIIANKETLGFHLTDFDYFKNKSSSKHSRRIQINSLKNYMTSLMNTVFDTIDQRYLNEHDYKRSVWIDSLGISPTQFNLTLKDKKALIKSGKKAAKNYFQDKEKNKV